MLQHDGVTVNSSLRYAVHNVGASLTLKKHGEPAAIVRTTASANQVRLLAYLLEGGVAAQLTSEVSAKQA